MRLQEMELNFGHTDGRTDRRTEGWTDKRGSQNSYLDALFLTCLQAETAEFQKLWIKKHFLHCPL